MNFSFDFKKLNKYNMFIIYVNEERRRRKITNRLKFRRNLCAYKYIVANKQTQTHTNVEEI